MFFRQEKPFSMQETALPNLFFAQILPITEPLFIKIYLYGYYISQRQDNEEMDNAAIAKELGIDVEEVWQAWDFFEGCNLIKKHLQDNTPAGGYSVEFLDLWSLAKTINQQKDLSVDELLVLSEGEAYQKMYESIEKILKMPLTPGEILKLNKAIAQYGYNKTLVAEAFSYCAYKNKPRTMNSALGVLRTWHLSGIQTVEELQEFLAKKDKRYGQYRQILGFLGEYRSATKAEIELMDTWLEKYKFSMEVIENACQKSTAIKNPNMKYINGVLKNWYEKVKDQGIVLHQPPNEDETEFRIHVLDLIGHKGALQKNDLDSLRFLFGNFTFLEVSQGVDFLRKSGEAITLLNLYQLFQDPSGKISPTYADGDQENAISLEAVKKAVGSGKKLVKKEEREKNGPTALEQKLVKKRVNTKEG